jgi:hypothetical protein
VADDVESAAKLSGQFITQDHLNDHDPNCFVEENAAGELAAYLFFNKHLLQNSLTEGKTFGVVFNNIVRITEGSADGHWSYNTALDGEDLKDDPEYQTLVDDYKTAHSVTGGDSAYDAYPYIVRHILKTKARGILELAVQPEDSVGNFPKFADAGKAKVKVVYMPKVPQGLAVTGSTPESISLSWGQVPDTASYEVHRSATEGGAYT